MKLNWGHKLTIFTVAFMLFIIACVTFMMKQNVDLVDADYYEKGIKYQEEIDQSKESYRLVNIDLDSNAAMLTVTALDSSINKMEGDLFFYRPSDKSKDFSIKVGCSYNEPFKYSVSALAKGPWKVTILWEDESGKHQLLKEFNL